MQSLFRGSSSSTLFTLQFSAVCQHAWSLHARLSCCTHGAYQIVSPYSDAAALCAQVYALIDGEADHKLFVDTFEEHEQAHVRSVHVRA